MFDTDQDAYNEAMKTIREEGAAAFSFLRGRLYGSMLRGLISSSPPPATWRWSFKLSWSGTARQSL